MKKIEFDRLMDSIREAGRIRRGEAKASSVTEFAQVNKKGDKRPDHDTPATINEQFPVRSRYTVSDGKIVLSLESAEEGGYVVTSPLDPELITQAETLEEAFANARDAAQALKRARTKE